MPTPSVVHDTFAIERRYPQPPARVFAALADPAVKRRWFAEGESHDVDEFAMEFRPGGTERLRVRLTAASVAGLSLVHEGTFQDIVQDRRVVTASTMTLGGRRISASLVTLELVPDGSGTTLVCTHQAAFFEGADGPTMRQGGWGRLLDALGKELAR